MAVQNDNTILNKGDLKAYHERIAPMLGGTFMVSTNNSDYYSTSEKVIGVWTDGKPLYQKTVFFTTPSVVDTNTSVYTDPDTTIKIQDLSGEVCWSTSQGFYARPINRYFPPDPNDYIAAYGGGTGNVVVMAVGSYYTSKDAYATIRYTKTTDAAGSATTTPGAYDINFPNTWPANKEIFFGNGLYGQRFTRSTATATMTQYVLQEGVSKIISVGGTEWRTGDGYGHPMTVNPEAGSYPYFYIQGDTSSGGVGKLSIWGAKVTMKGWDVWATYCK